MPTRVVILLTPSTFSSEGPRNYIVRLKQLLADFKFDVIVVNVKRFPSMLFNVIKIIISHPKSAFIFPYVRFPELLTIFVAFPLALISRGRIVTVVHDIHGFYFGNKLLWHILIKLRSGPLIRMPSLRHIYVSRYSKMSSLLLLCKGNMPCKTYVIYPFKNREEMFFNKVRRSFRRKEKRLLVFSKVSKMLDNEEFWKCLGVCLERLADCINEVIIMGSGSSEDIKKVKRVIEETWPETQKSKIIYCFNVSDQLRDTILQSACLMIYPPSLEGLGLPVFEAVLYHVPVLSSRQTALIEFIPRDLYMERKVKYPDLYYVLSKYINDIDHATDYTKRLKLSLAKLTLNEILRFLKD